MRRVVLVFLLCAMFSAIATPAAAQESGPLPNLPPGFDEDHDDCAEVVVIVASDADAQSDVYAAALLAGALGTSCILDAGDRSGSSLPPVAAAVLARNPASVYVVGGTAAVPSRKLRGAQVVRIGGIDRWHTIRLVGARVASLLDSTTAVATRYSAIAAGSYACGLRKDGTLSCWGGTAEEPSGRFASVSVGTNHMCALGVDGDVSCWGGKDFRRASAPTGSFTSISAGGSERCGVRESGTIACWGRIAEAPSGQFTDVASGPSHICGVRTDKSIQCWGPDGRGGADPSAATDSPTGSYTKVAAGRDYSCGLRTGGAIRCWGNEDYSRLYDYGLTNPPTGRFVAMSAGSLHACGIRISGAVKCWGDDAYGQLNAPAGKFTEVAVGVFYSCGLRDDGTIQCWGRDDQGQLQVP